MATEFGQTVFVITGAASGIGRQLALQAAARGAHVIATDCNGAALQETKTLAEKEGYTLTTQVVDVADPFAIEAFASAVQPLLGHRKLVLVNNAGIALSGGDFWQNRPEDFERVLQVNLWGTIRMTRAFYPYMLAQKCGHIVNLSSVFGLIGVAQNTAYCTAKFGVRGFTESLRMELMGTGIQTTCVHPGGVKTNIVQDALTNPDTFDPLLHQKAVDSFAAQARTTAATAAAEILKAIAQKKARLVIGRDGKAIDWLARLLPVGYTRIVARRLQKAFGVDG